MSKTPSPLILLLLSAFACQQARQAAPAAAPPETLESFVLRETGVDLLDSAVIRNGPFIHKSEVGLDDSLQIRLYYFNGPSCTILEDIQNQRFYMDCDLNTVALGTVGLYLLDTSFLLNTRQTIATPSYYRKPVRLIEDLLNSRYQALLPTYSEVKVILEAVAFPAYIYQYASENQETIGSWRAARNSIMADPAIDQAHKETFAAYLDGAFDQVLSRSHLQGEPWQAYEYRYFNNPYFYQIFVHWAYFSGSERSLEQETRYRYFIQIERIPLYY